MAPAPRPRSRPTCSTDDGSAPATGVVSCGADGRRIPTIALVDDEESIRRVLDRLLEHEGFAAVHAASVGQFVAAMESQVIDGVLLDLGLQGNESGLDALEWIRAQPRFAATPVLVLTGRPDLSADDQAFIERHDAQVFQKGQSLEPLIAQLTQLVRRDE